MGSASEQLIRAERLRDLGLVDVVHPDDLSPQVLSEWLACPKEPSRARSLLDFNGLSRLTQLLEEMLRANDRGLPTRPDKKRIKHVAS